MSVKEVPAGLGLKCQASRVPGCTTGVVPTAVSVQRSGQRGCIVLYSEAGDVGLTSASSEMPSAVQ